MNHRVILNNFISAHNSEYYCALCCRSLSTLLKVSAILIVCSNFNIPVFIIIYCIFLNNFQIGRLANCSKNPILLIKLEDYFELWESTDLLPDRTALEIALCSCLRTMPPFLEPNLLHYLSLTILLFEHSETREQIPGFLVLSDVRKERKAKGWNY